VAGGYIRSKIGRQIFHYLFCAVEGGALAADGDYNGLITVYYGDVGIGMRLVIPSAYMKDEGIFTEGIPVRTRHGRPLHGAYKRKVGIAVVDIAVIEIFHISCHVIDTGPSGTS